MKMFLTNPVERIKTRTLCSVFFLNRAFYEIIWKKVWQRHTGNRHYNTAHALSMLEN